MTDPTRTYVHRHLVAIGGWHCQACATAERKRIAAALPEALATALCHIPELHVPGGHTDEADAILAHPAVRAVLQPEGES